MSPPGAPETPPGTPGTAVGPGGRLGDQPWRPRVLFPERRTVPAVLAAVAGWLGVLLLIPALVGLGLAVLASGTDDDSGATGAFALAGLVAAAVLLAGANGMVRLDRAGPAPVRVGGAVLATGVVAAAAAYPFAAIRDPGPLAVVVAVVVAVLGVLAVVAAWSVLRRR